MKTRNLLILAVILPWLTAYSQQTKSTKSVKPAFVAMFYNVENLYDTFNDPKTNDDDFTPAGKVPWTEERLQTKIEHLSQVISDINSPGMPDFIGLAETENKEVLELLTTSEALQKTKYSIIHYNSPDERGIDVAALYNPATFKIITSEPLQVVLPGNDLTRDILYIKGKLNSGEILHIFVNHWPSRREGTELSDPKRMAAAQILRTKTDAILKTEKSPNILIMGDFNDEPADKSITEGIKALSPELTISNKNLYNLLNAQYKKGEGSLYYKDWDLFDQIIVSGNLLSRKKGLHTTANDASIFKADYMLFKTKTGESRPNRTMGDKYFGGYSDHLPVYVRLFLN